MTDTYAIIESGGKQYRAEKGETLVVDRLPAAEGDKINLRAVMFRGEKDDQVVVGGTDLEKVKVEAKVTGHERGEKIRVFRYRAKKGYRKRSGHRSELTRLEVIEVKMLSRKPVAKKDDEGEATKAEAKPKAAAKPKPATKTPAAKKPAAKKPSDETEG